MWQGTAGTLGTKWDPKLMSSFIKAGTLVLKLQWTDFCQQAGQFATGSWGPERNVAWTKFWLHPCETDPAKSNQRCAQTLDSRELWDNIYMLILAKFMVNSNSKLTQHSNKNLLSMLECVHWRFYCALITLQNFQNSHYLQQIHLRLWGFH